MPTPEDTNAASRAGDVAPGETGLEVSSEEDTTTLPPDAEGSSDRPLQPVRDEAIAGLWKLTNDPSRYQPERRPSRQPLPGVQKALLHLYRPDTFGGGQGGLEDGLRRHP